MTDLEAAISRLREHPGVDNVILLGRDGLIVHRDGPDATAEHLAARLPALVNASESVGAAGDRGRFLTTVVEFDRGVLIALPLANDLLLAVTVRPGVGFAALLADLRRQRDRLGHLL